jgi:hypothetical protein
LNEKFLETNFTNLRTNIHEARIISVKSAKCLSAGEAGKAQGFWKIVDWKEENGLGD